MHQGSQAKWSLHSSGIQIYMCLLIQPSSAYWWSSMRGKGVSGLHSLQCFEHFKCGWLHCKMYGSQYGHVIAIVQFFIYIWNILCIATLSSSCFLCRQVIEVQHIVNVLAGWLALRLQKTDKSFIVQCTFEIPIGVSENNDTVPHPLHLSVYSIINYHSTSVMYNSIVILINSCE